MSEVSKSPARGPSLVWFTRPQPYALTIFGEKSSLEDVLGPIARRFSADLYLGAGEISDTLLYRMAKDGVEDGRPIVVATICDFDPAGHQMPVSIGRAIAEVAISGIEMSRPRTGH